MTDTITEAERLLAKVKEIPLQLNYADFCERVTELLEQAMLAAEARGVESAIPEGWQIVPKEITCEMAHRLESNLAECFPPCEAHKANWRYAYQSMLAAAPKQTEAKL